MFQFSRLSLACSCMDWTRNSKGSSILESQDLCLFSTPRSILSLDTPLLVSGCLGIFFFKRQQKLCRIFIRQKKEIKGLLKKTARVMLATLTNGLATLPCTLKKNMTENWIIGRRKTMCLVCPVEFVVVVRYCSTSSLHKKATSFDCSLLFWMASMALGTN